jgi:hypothetical protein
MKKVEFDGGWLELREPDEVTNAGRRAIRASMASTGGKMADLVKLTAEELETLGVPDDAKATPEQLEQAANKAGVRLSLTVDESERMQMLNDAALVAVIGRWSLSEPISRATLDEMPVGLYDKIMDAGKQYAVAALLERSVEFSPTSADPASQDPTGA